MFAIVFASITIIHIQYLILIIRNSFKWNQIDIFLNFDKKFKNQTSTFIVKQFWSSKIDPIFFTDEKLDCKEITFALMHIFMNKYNFTYLEEILKKAFFSLLMITFLHLFKKDSRQPYLNSGLLLLCFD